MTIMYGLCIGNDVRYERCARVGLDLVTAELIYEVRGKSSIFVAYNEILDEARAVQDLDALVLLHEDLEIRDRDFEPKVLAALDDSTAIVGTIGGRGVRGARWRQAEEFFGFQPDSESCIRFSEGTHDVDQVDGCIMALSPWAVENLRFDENTFRGFHAYDADICMQARAASKRVRVIDLDTIHYNTPGFGNISNHQRSDDAFRKKWGLPYDRLRWRLPRRYPRTIGRVRRLLKT